MLGQAMCASWRTSSAASALYTLRSSISADIVDNELSSSSAQASRKPPPGKAKLNEWMEAYLVRIFRLLWRSAATSRAFTTVFCAMWRPHLSLQLSTATRGNQIKAAELLGLNRNTLRKKVREQKIRVVRSPV